MKKIPFYTKQFVERAGRLFDRDRERIDPTPYRDWMFSLTVFFILGLFSAVVGYFISLQVSREDFFKEESDTGKESKLLDAKELQVIIKAEEEKALLFEKVRKSPPI